MISSGLKAVAFIGNVCLLDRTTSAFKGGNKAKQGGKNKPPYR